MQKETTTYVNEFGKTVTVVQWHLSEEEKLLRDVLKRKETLMNERSAISVAKKEAREEGRQEGMQEGMQKGIQEAIRKRDVELMAKLKNRGYTDEQIRELLS